MSDERLALFLLLGKTVAREMASRSDVALAETLHVSELQDLSALLPEATRLAFKAAEAYKLFFVFETYLREFLVEVLSKNGVEEWWDKLPATCRTKSPNLRILRRPRVGWLWAHVTSPHS